MNTTRLLVSAVAVALLAGCSLAPNYERPEAPIAAAWPQSEASRNAKLLTQGLAQWGDFFVDSRLRTLIETALRDNRSLRTAFFNVERARALYNVSRGELLPSVAAVASESASRTPANMSMTRRDSVSHIYSANAAMASFELDLFGRIRNLNEQALQAFMQTEAAQRAAQMTVIAEIAQTWLGLGTAKELLSLSRQTLASQQESFALVKKSYELGSASRIEVEQARTTVANAKVALAQASRAESQYRNALSMLIGGALAPELEPSRIELNFSKAVSTISNVPSEVLLQRPDIAAAEAQLKSAYANIGVARAAFFPRIALTASFGTASPEMSNLFDAGQRVWSWAPQITLPIFTAGRNMANLQAAEAAQKAAIASYEGAIQSAFREVADALVTEGTVQDELKAREELAKATGTAFMLAQERYKSGVDSYLMVLDSQRANFSAQQALILARQSRAASLVTLYKVLGGGSQLSGDSTNGH